MARQPFPKLILAAMIVLASMLAWLQTIQPQGQQPSEAIAGGIFDLNAHLLIPPIRHSGWVSSAVFSHDERKILTSSSDGVVRLFDAATGKDLVRPMLHGTLSRWIPYHVRSIWLKLTSPFGKERFVTGALFSPDDSKILTHSFWGTIRIFDAATGEELATAMQHVSGVLSAAFSRESGKILTSSYDNTARLFDASTGKELVPPMHHSGPVWNATFSKDEAYIYTCSGQGESRLFDAKTGKDLLAIRSQAAARWNETSCENARRSLDRNHHLFKKMRCCGARFFDAAISRWPDSAKPQEGRIAGVVFSRDKGKILTRSHDGIVWLWGVSASHQIPDEISRSWSMARHNSNST